MPDPLPSDRNEHHGFTSALMAVSAQPAAEVDLADESFASNSDPLPEPEGPDILFFSDNFDSERYGTTGGVVIPRLGFRPGMAGVKPKPPYPAARRPRQTL